MEDNRRNLIICVVVRHKLEVHHTPVIPIYIPDSQPVSLIPETVKVEEKEDAVDTGIDNYVVKDEPYDPFEAVSTPLVAPDFQQPSPTQVRMSFMYYSRVIDKFGHNSIAQRFVSQASSKYINFTFNI